MFDATISSADISTVLATAQRLVNNKPTIPVLGNVLIQAEADAAIFSATDTEIGFRAKVKASSVSPGEVTISARLLNDLVRSLPTTSVRLLGDGTGHVAMTAAAFRGKLSTLPPSDFPTLPTAPDVGVISLPRTELRDAIARTRFATTEGDTRYFLNGAKLEPRDGAFRLVATDGHRLAIVDGPRVGAGGEPSILPRKTLDALASMLENSSGELVDYVKGENHIFFRVGDSLLISRMIEAEYPTYERIVPAQPAQVANVERTAFLSALRRLHTVSDQAAPQVKFTLAKGVVRVSARNSQVGDADEEVAAGYDGGEFAAGLNVKYAIDFLDAAGTDGVSLSITGPNRQVVFAALGGAVSYRYIVMPVSLKPEN